MDPTNRNTALASALVEELARSGASHAVISPGSRSTPLALALWRHPDIQCRVVLDERCAGFIALGMALASGRPAIVTCTSGSAAANLHPAVVEANEAGVPMIVLTADRPPELRGIGAGQAIDQIKLFGDSVRWFCEVGSHEADDKGILHFRATGCRAWAEANGSGSTPGPVHINVPFRDPLGPEPRPDDLTAQTRLALEGRGGTPLTIFSSPSGPDEDALRRASELIAGATRGLIVAGRQLDPDLAAPVIALASMLDFPILAEPTSQLRFGPHARDLVVENYDSIARSRPAHLVPDLILRVGDMPTSKSLRSWLDAQPTLGQIALDPPGRWNEPSRRAELIIRGRTEASLLALTEAATAPDLGDSWAEAWAAADRSAEEAIAAILDRGGDSSGISEPGVHRALGRIYPSGIQVVLASSMPIRDQEAFAGGSENAVRFFANRGANGIDGTVSTAVGVAEASGRPTWAVIGDLALAHDVGGLANLGTTRAPVTLIVINNDGGGIFEFLPQAGQIDRDEFEALFGTPSGLDLEKLSALFEVEYELVEDPSLIDPQAQGSRLLEIRADRSHNVEVHRSLAQAVSDSLS